MFKFFEHEGLGEIRAFLKDGEPWFIAKDVCDVLGFVNNNESTKKAIQRIKETSYGAEVTTSEVRIKYPSGTKKLTIIPEQVLYELIFASKKPIAKEFRGWVIHEVLPSLKRFGFYRDEGKFFRRGLTDTIKEVLHPEDYKIYVHYTNLINKTVGLPQKNKRDELDSETLKKLSDIEKLGASLIENGYLYEDIKEILAKQSHLKLVK